MVRSRPHASQRRISNENPPPSFTTKWDPHALHTAPNVIPSGSLLSAQSIAVGVWQLERPRSSSFSDGLDRPVRPEGPVRGGAGDSGERGITARGAIGH